jgi:hypothetical protein
MNTITLRQKAAQAIIDDYLRWKAQKQATAKKSTQQNTRLVATTQTK